MKFSTLKRSVNRLEQQLLIKGASMVEGDLDKFEQEKEEFMGAVKAKLEKYCMACCLDDEDDFYTVLQAIQVVYTEMYDV